MKLNKGESMQIEHNEIEVNGVKYVKKSSQETAMPATNVFMVRSYAAGVFYGEIESKKHEVSGLVVTMKNARRVWYWAGAASLSQLATEGTKKPHECKFPAPVSSVELMNVVEIIPLTEAALKNLNGVAVWKQ
jgi:hypothetical protein